MEKPRFQRAVMILFLASIVLSINIAQVKAQTVGVKVGDWVKYGVTGNFSGLTDIDWMKIEVTKVAGTNITVNVTGLMVNGTEFPSQETSFDVGSSQGNFAGIGYIIPANLEVGDTVSFSGTEFGITQEATRTYGGASRTVVGMNISMSGVSAAIFWDKATGILLEASMSYGGQSLNIIASSTSMGGGEPLNLAWWIWVVLIAAIVAVVVGVVLVLRKRRQATVTPPQPEIPPPPSST